MIKSLVEEQSKNRLLRKGSPVKVDFYEFGVRTHINRPFESTEEATKVIDSFKNESTGHYGVIVQGANQ